MLCGLHLDQRPKPNDWPEHVNNTGYWFLSDAGDSPSAELINFLGQGEAPVYVGFGSMGDPTQAAATTKLVAEALRLSGQRGILQTGWGRLSKNVSLNSDVLILERAPHVWLFPKVSAVVHHGGAGTTHTGLCAGVPNIVIPSGNDQFAWGKRVSELGVGPEPIPMGRLSSQRLADAIKYASREEVQLNAKRLGLLIQSEDGAKTATRIISSCINMHATSFI
jgi:sterol 3beta-glucosyltransferase